MTAAEQDLKIERVPIDSVRPLKRNPRRGDVEKVRRSLRRWGQYVPIVVRAETDEIVKGNHTWQAAREEGAETIAIVRRSIPDQGEAEALAIADNAASDAASCDIPLLAEILTTDGVEVDATLLDPVDVDGILAKAEQLQIAETDAAAAAGLREPGTPEPPNRPTTRPGDRYQLGDSVLVCGDATRPADLELLLADTPAKLTFTDPPYGVSYRDTSGGSERVKVRLRQRGVKLEHRFEKIDGDDLDPEELLAFLVAAFTNVADHADPKAPLYTFHASRTASIFEAALADAGYQIRAQIIWSKSRPAFNMGQYKYAHEPCFYAFRRGKTPYWWGDHSQTTVWPVAQDHGADYQHPTQKPVKLGAAAIVNSSRPGDIVLDPFAGSGSVLLCAHQLDRRGYALELDPAYCDVIVARWEELTGETAERQRRAPKRRTRKETTA